MYIALIINCICFSLIQLWRLNWRVSMKSGLCWWERSMNYGASFWQWLSRHPTPSMTIRFRSWNVTWNELRPCSRMPTANRNDLIKRDPAKCSSVNSRTSSKILSLPTQHPSRVASTLNRNSLRPSNSWKRLFVSTLTPRSTSGATEKKATTSTG